MVVTVFETASAKDRRVARLTKTPRTNPGRRRHGRGPQSGRNGLIERAEGQEELDVLERRSGGGDAKAVELYERVIERSL